MQRKYVNKVLPLLLVICLIASSIPMTVWANEASPDILVSTFDDFSEESIGQSNYGISETSFSSVPIYTWNEGTIKMPDCWYGILPGESLSITVPYEGILPLDTFVILEGANGIDVRDVHINYEPKEVCLSFYSSDNTPTGISKVNLVFVGMSRTEDPSGSVITMEYYNVSNDFLFCVWEKYDRVIEVVPVENSDMYTLSYNVRTRNMESIDDDDNYFVTLSNHPTYVSHYFLYTYDSGYEDRGNLWIYTFSNTPFGPYTSTIRYDGVVSNEFEIKYEKEEAELNGTVLIEGEALVGKTLEANTSGLTSEPEVDMGELSYQWHRASKDKKTGGTTDYNTYPVPIENAIGSTYTPIQDDIDYTLTVTVTAANCNGSVTSEETDYVFQRVGYSFNHTREAFGYPSYINDNPINILVYQRVFPNVWSIKYYNDSQQDWLGHCNGMAHTVQLFRAGLLKEEDFQGGATEPWEFAAPTSIIRLRSEIEAYQIVQDKPEIKSLYLNRYSGLILETALFEEGKGAPVVLGILRYDTTTKTYTGHAVAPYRVEFPDTGNYYKIYVYDPNYPYSKEHPTEYKNSIVYISKDLSHWTYNQGGVTYDSRDYRPAYLYYVNSTKVNNLLETPSFINDSAAGAATDVAVTLNVAGQKILMETYDLEDVSGTVSRHIKVGAVENSYPSQDFFISETKEEISISAKSYGNHIKAYIYNADGGAVINAQASTEDALYTFTVEPGISAKLSGDENKRDMTMAFAFPVAEDLVLFDMNARAAGEVTLTRVNENDILISGKDIENLVISQDDKDLITLANAPDNVILRMEYENDGTIKSAAFYSDTNEEPIDKELVSKENSGGKAVGKATIVDYLMGKNKTDQTTQTEPQNQTPNNSQSQGSQDSASQNTPINDNEEKSAIPGFDLIFAVAAVAGLVGVGAYQKKKNGKQ